MMQSESTSSKAKDEPKLDDVAGEASDVAAPPDRDESPSEASGRHRGALAPVQRELFGHPVGLYVLFFTEMWERFCYYGMRAILVYYMTKYLFLPGVQEHVLGHAAISRGLSGVFGATNPQTMSSQIYGWYTGLVYLTPLFGGMLADRYLGQRKTVVLGGLVMAVGEFMLMNKALFYPALLILIMGNGAFKPNISTQVGDLYPKGDPRRDRAFNIFYVGINLGAFLSPLVCGTLGETVGWHWGFGSAGVGLLFGLAVYVWGQKYLAPDNIMRTQEPQATLQSGEGYRGSKVVEPAKKQKFTREEWAKIIALCVLCFLNILFWATYEQQGNTLALWADGNTNRQVLAFMGIKWEMPASWFQSVNPFFIFAFTPFINMLWKRQAEKGTEPNSVAKMAIGCGLLAVSFLVMIGGARVYASGGLASAWWLIGCTFLLTIGELYLSPVGLSLVTKISPVRIVSMMMGMWFLSSFAGNYLSGYIGTFWDKMSKEAFFILLSALSAVTGVLMVALYRPLKKAIGDENAKDA
jgi:POT family proton-dependent oligopeptide transporter